MSDKFKISYNILENYVDVLLAGGNAISQENSAEYYDIDEDSFSYDSSDDNYHYDTSRNINTKNDDGISKNKDGEIDTKIGEIDTKIGEIDTKIGEIDTKMNAIINSQCDILNNITKMNEEIVKMQKYYYEMFQTNKKIIEKMEELESLSMRKQYSFYNQKM